MNPASVHMPSASGLLLRVGIAALVGAVLTVCVIMPAEYRKDPTGFGKLTGLIALATPTVAKPADANASGQGNRPRPRSQPTRGSIRPSTGPTR